MRALDMFAGAGGVSVGLDLLGMDVVGIDHDPHACATHAAAGWPTIRADLTGHLPVTGPVDFVQAGFPCTAFSMAGKGEGRDDAPRLVAAILAEQWDPWPDRSPLSWMILRTMDQILGLSPTALMLENVPPTLPVMAACAEVFRRHGWHTAHGVLSAEAFGVAQTRRRAFLIANRDRPVSLPEPTHETYGSEPDPDQGMLFGVPLLPWVSMASALGWETPDRPYPTLACSNVTGVGGSGARQVLYDLAAADSWVHDRPATTLVSSFCPDIIAAPGYRQAGDGPRQNAPGSIRITVPEAARLQAFPTGHPWQGSRTAQYVQVGNACPPPLAAAVAGAACGLDWQQPVANYLAGLYAAGIAREMAA